MTEDMKMAVENFATFMVSKLDRNMHKGGVEGWRKMGIAFLVDLLDREVVELKKAIYDRKTTYSLTCEAADVANFAMMIADVYTCWEADHEQNMANS